MRRQSLGFLILIVILAASALYIDINPGNRGLKIDWLGINNSLQLKQGLDLQGGIQFLYKASCPTTIPNCDVGSDIQPTIDNISNRISGGLGVNEAVVDYQKDPQSGDYYISVQLPGLKDDKQASDLIGQTGQLAFIDTAGNFLQTGTVVDPTQYEGKLTPFTGKDLDPNSINVSFDHPASHRLTSSSKATPRLPLPLYAKQRRQISDHHARQQSDRVRDDPTADHWRG